MTEMPLDTENWDKDQSPYHMHIARKKLKVDRLLSEKGKPKEPKPLGLKCSWCKEEMSDVYYKCKYHKHLFCKECATKEGQFTRRDYPVCKESRIDRKECIWERFGEEFLN